LKLVLPKEHGAWAMWIVPYIVGIFAAKFVWLHLLLFISLFFAYISISPLMMVIKRSKRSFEYLQIALIYLAISLIFLIYPIVHYPSLIYILLAEIPILIINSYFAVKKNERSLLNDIIVISGLTSTIFFSYIVGNGSDIKTISELWLWNFLFFISTIFYVKSFIREKDNRTFKKLAKGYGLLLNVVAFMINGLFFLFPFLFTFLRALFTPAKSKPWQIGIIEIFNSLWFLSGLIIYLFLQES